VQTVIVRKLAPDDELFQKGVGLLSGACVGQGFKRHALRGDHPEMQVGGKARADILIGIVSVHVAWQFIVEKFVEHDPGGPFSRFHGQGLRSCAAAQSCFEGQKIRRWTGRGPWMRVWR
jgi:hypothetical protein